MKNSTPKPGNMNELLVRKLARLRAEGARMDDVIYEQIDAAGAELEAKCKRRSEAGRNTIIADMDRAVGRIRLRIRRLERRWGLAALGDKNAQ